MIRRKRTISRTVPIVSDSVLTSMNGISIIFTRQNICILTYESGPNRRARYQDRCPLTTAGFCTMTTMMHGTCIPHLPGRVLGHILCNMAVSRLHFRGTSKPHMDGSSSGTLKEHLVDAPSSTYHCSMLEIALMKDIKRRTLNEGH